MSKLTGKPLHENEDDKKPRRRQAPGSTIEAREDHITRLAYDLVEKRIKNGSATSQEVTHFLKTGSSQGRLELEKLKNENELLKAKTESIAAQKNIGELYIKAMEAFGIYRGHDEQDYPDNDED